MSQTGSNNRTYFFENGQQVYPCRCGKTHRGEYAAEDFLHHECLHGEFTLLEKDLAMCSLCGATFEIKVERE